ncbi:MAG: TetR/AcrR family transcriptional regulator [Pseudomonadota bacterium]
MAKHQAANKEIGWQAQKSAMTRQRILNAAIDCFINEGYNRMTTAKVASNAGVSRGAMLHHFPSKTELIQATVEYLHKQLIEDFSSRVSQIPGDLAGSDRHRAGLAAYWEHLTGDLFIAYHELCVAGRTDEELGDILKNSQRSFERHVAESNGELFSDWNERGELFLLAMDLTKFLMEGMALGQLTSNRDKRIERMIGYLGDRLEEIFESGDDTAVQRHSSGPD